MTDDTPWRATAIDMAVNLGAYDDETYSVEAVENLLMGLVCGLLDVADAIRELGARPETVARLTDAAPIAEALTLLLRAQDQEPAEQEDR